MSALATLSGMMSQHVVNQAGEKVEWDSITGEGKFLGLYFSAHWCPPCRGFTPKLADYYDKMKKNRSDFEIIFVSSDKDEAAFKDYFNEMPWLALKFDERDVKAKLSSKYGVRGIPTLVILDAATGETITAKARSKVESDPDGFPWRPQSFAEVFYSGDFIKNDGTKVPSAEVKSKVKAVYFSAHWCPPCRGFTPELVKTYNKLKERDGVEFEIIFASSDKDEASFKEYFAEMPWLSLPFGDSRKAALSDMLDVEGIPTLAIFDAQDKVITKDGRSAISSDPEGKEFPWLPKPVNELTESSAGLLNEKACLIYFTGGDDGEVTKAKECLKPAADKEFNLGDQDSQQIFFLYTGEDDEMPESLKRFTKLTNTEPFVVIVNIPERNLYVYEGELSAEGISKLAADYIAGKLQSRSI